MVEHPPTLIHDCGVPDNVNELLAHGPHGRQVEAVKLHQLCSTESRERMRIIASSCDVTASPVACAHSDAGLATRSSALHSPPPLPVAAAAEGGARA